MQGILLEVAYDGTNYCGFQFQKNGITVQEVLENSISKMEKRFVRIKGASRTDSGVHALGQRIFYPSTLDLSDINYLKGLNSSLPKDVAITSIKRVEPDFRPRHTAGKIYQYKIRNSLIPNPLDNRYHWHVYKKLNVELMKKAVGYFEGTHDFSSFRAAACESRHAIRKITKISLEGEQELLLTVAGTAFVQNMIRIIAGTLVIIGKEFQKPEFVKELLNIQDRTKAGPTAPAKGLCLQKVIYPDEDTELLIRKSDEKKQDSKKNQPGKHSFIAST
ncbi:MAG: tRNA pseudouridine(38-40) synthase TruA [Deltaproteobacteria bacterium]|nr:tRNA pseudouridine(38-40) synthase TruA [Deltaproteobacteria bacterium]